MWNGAVKSTLIRKTGRHEFITGAEAAGTAFEGAGNEPGKATLV
jgi:hypothetical protein